MENSGKVNGYPWEMGVEGGGTYSGIAVFEEKCVTVFWVCDIMVAIKDIV